MMRRFLIIGQLDGQAETLANLREIVEQRRPDGILQTGGLGPQAPLSEAERLKRWEQCFNALGELRVFTALVPGPQDVPLREFLRLAKDAEMEHPTLHVAHATLWEEGDVAVCGLGGKLSEDQDRTEEELCYSRASAEYYLRTLWRAEQPHKILLFAAAPPGQLGGDTGNRICGDFIDSYHPTLCVVSGLTEHRGVQRIAHTTVVNPGSFIDGSAAWLDWKRPKEEQVEFLGPVPSSA
ncbi:MAG: heat-stable protein [Gemmatales bacterium]|nr:MAG: heat-stable protein [Gemmatales bacterium]